MKSAKGSAARSAILAAVAVGLFACIYVLRPLAIIHDTTWFLFVKYPTIWLIPTLVGLVFAALVGGALYLRKRSEIAESRGKLARAAAETAKYDRDGSARDQLQHWDHWESRSRRSGPAGGSIAKAAALAFFVSGLVAFIPTAVLASNFSAEAVYHHYRYVEIKKLPAGGEVRIVPREVAEKSASIGYNLSGHSLGAGHIVLDPRTHRLTWMFEQAPHSVFNKLRRSTEGVATLDAEETNRVFKEYDKTFTRAPSMHISDNTRWYILKKDFYSVPTDAIPVLTQTGEPVFVVPTLSYKGWPVKYPVVSRVYIFHANGRVESLSVAEASKRPEVVATGRIIPEGLAREIQNAYAYKHGIANIWFGHSDQIEIADASDSDNHQPYLMSFSQSADGKPLPHGVTEKLYWVSSAEPYGKAFATNAIFLTDAISGVTYVWRVPRDTSLTGANQAIQTAKSLAIPGIVWANDQDTGSGRYKAVEPRPVFVQGKLQYLISIIPTSHNDITKSVIVDAATNKVVAMFNHDTDPNADAKLVRYLRTGKLDQTATVTPEQGGQPNGNAPATPTAPAPSSADVKSLIAQNNELLKQVAANQARIEQLLKQSGK